MKISRIVLAVVSMAAFLFAAACQKNAADRTGTGSRRLSVVTSLFPVYDFARQVAGDKADVVLLLPPGTEPHSFDPRPGDIMVLNHADLFFYTSIYMEPWVRKIIDGIGNRTLLAVDTSTGIALTEAAETPNHKGHGDGPQDGHADRMDPHMWLDFSYAIKMVENIRDAFVSKDPANRSFYAANAAAYIQQLSVLDDRYMTSLSGCRKKIFVTGGHFTFGYLARKYGLTAVSAYGLSPNSEPTPGAVAKVARTLKENGLKHIFFEELITPRIAETIGRESDAELLMLHGAHNISKDEFRQNVTFLSLMEANLINLMIGLQCG